MRNCLILGSGRSGTSMLAGILSQAGYFMGEKLYKGLESNPKGFFEWKEINRINEEILSHYGVTVSSRILKRLIKKNLPSNPGKNQRWLLSLSCDVDVVNSNPSIVNRIGHVIKKEPFCYKDPRFSYTLPVWKPLLDKDTAFICIFREPSITIESILKECDSREYLSDFLINSRVAYKVWMNIYSHVLTKNHDIMDRLYFVHYHQIYYGTALPYLSKVLDAELRNDFVDKLLNRTVSASVAPKKVKKLYEKLCKLASF